MLQKWRVSISKTLGSDAENVGPQAKEDSKQKPTTWAETLSSSPGPHCPISDLWVSSEVESNHRKEYGEAG